MVRSVILSAYMLDECVTTSTVVPFGGAVENVRSVPDTT
jgi:hypothetical protein